MSRLAHVSLNSLTFSKWLPVSNLQQSFAVSVSVVVSSGANLTYSVQHSFDDPSLARLVMITQVASTTATITDLGVDGLGHGLSVADDVIVQGSGIGIDGEYAVASIVSATQYTITTTVNQTATSLPGARVTTFTVFNNASLVGQTTRGSTNYAFPITVTRLILTAYVSGVATMTTIQGLS